MTDHYRELLPKIRPDLAREVQRRLDESGDVAFLPTQLRLKKHRIWFPEGIGWIASPGFDPEKVPIQDIELIFVLRSPDGKWERIEIVMR